MAVTKNGRLSGVVGELIIYTSGGKEITRVRPNRIKQTNATKISARDFGNIKSLSSSLRAGLKDVLPAYKSKPIMFTMDEAVRRWYLDYYLRKETAVMDPIYFSGLRLNPEAQPYVKPLLGVEPLVEWDYKKSKVTLTIPEMKKEAMLLPPGAASLSITFHIAGATMCSRDIGKKGKVYWAKSFPINKSSEAIEIPLSKSGINGLTMELGFHNSWPDDLFLAFLSVRYKNSKGWIEIEKWKPIVVVGCSCEK